jgi:HD-GYP domain-containing protein (c-di-GMP phosphodiesterase class II)
VRLVPLNRIPDDAVLGRDVSSGHPDRMPLLREGSKLTPRFRDKLVRAGVHAVYVTDAATDGIEPELILSAETRAAAAQAVATTMDSARAAMADGRPLPPDALAGLEAIAIRMAAEIAQTSELGLALADLCAADSYTLQHSVDTAALGLLIGQRLFRQRGYMDFNGRRSFERIDVRLTRLGLGLLLHDIGKLVVPNAILCKHPGALEDHEREILRSHPAAGLELLSSDLISPLVKVVVRSHHERWDGGGYPEGKAGAEIHELARIAAVADAYDATTSERPYATARPAHVGVRAIREGRGTAFDPEVVDEFAKLVAPFPPGVAVELSDGRGGVVAEVPEGALDRPVVRVLGDGEPYDLELAAHPRVQISGWEDMSPVPELPNRWADRLAASRQAARTNR